MATRITMQWRTDGRRSEDVKDVPDVPLQGENNNLVNFMDFPNTFEGLYKDLLESNNLVQFCIRAVAVWWWSFLATVVELRWVGGGSGSK